MYKLSKENDSVVKNDVLAIPFDPDNTDYQQYLNPKFLKQVLQIVFVPYNIY